MNTNPRKYAHYKEVIYNSVRWTLLQEYRRKAIQIMTALESFNMQTLIHGSIVRGDVDEKSDVDIFIPETQSSFLIESALEQAKIPVSMRLLVQATPTYAMKGYIEINARTSVSFPLMRMRRVEREFYKFGGEITLQLLRSGARVAGVDKRLMLIEPTESGHTETSIIGIEGCTAKVLGISMETVLDRAHTLLKRNEVGRTGVFIKRELTSNETFELALQKLAEGNPAVRRRLKRDRS